MPRRFLSKGKALIFIQWFLLSGLAIIGAFIINGLFTPDLFLVIVVAPIAEELAKTAVIMLHKKKSPKRTTRVGLLVGLGFGIFEAVSVNPAIILVRLFTSIPLHISAAGIDGYAVGSKRYWMIAGSIGLHSIYNSVANSGFILAPNIGILFAVIPLVIIYFYLRNEKVEPFKPPIDSSKLKRH
jgi:RsiW-degrading membrane proteinase PrsW (M82 family)